MARCKTYRRKTVFYLCLVGTLLFSAPTRACDVPVFRYAMEHWAPDPYEAILFHRGPLSESALEAVARLQTDASRVNLLFGQVDLDEVVEPSLLQLWKEQPADALPWLVVRYALAAPGGQVVWSTPFDIAAVERLVDSPLRREIGRRYLLNEPNLVIGRHPIRAQLVVGDLEASSTHAAVQKLGGRFTITDLGSLNGTQLNGTPLVPRQPQVMSDGDKLFVGRSVLKFTFQDELEEDFHVRVEQMINIDDLTGLVVKRTFDQRFEWALREACMAGTQLCVLMMDMDGLKGINDTHGHHVGASTISQVGRILGEIVNPRGCVTRFGGDEFTAYIENCDRPEGLRVAEQIRATIQDAHFQIGAAVVHPTISIGLSSMPQDGNGPAEVVRAADAALYRAKAAGRNCVAE